MKLNLFIGLQKVSLGYLFSFFSTKTSIFRLYQNLYVSRVSNKFQGYVIECGASHSNNYKSYFSNFSDYKISNITGSYDLHVDITRSSLEDSSVDGLVLVSVLEHIYNIESVVSEIERVLKPGGKALITIPAMCSIHGDEDYWRINIQGIEKLFYRFKLRDLTVFGGIYSSIFNALQRPKGNLRKRYVINKLLAIPFFIMGKLFDNIDDFPLGYGFIIEKNNAK